MECANTSPSSASSICPNTRSKGDLDSIFTAFGKPLFSAGIIDSTTDKWGKNALDAPEQTKPVARNGLPDLE
jgi:predicted helicase